MENRGEKRLAGVDFEKLKADVKDAKLTACPLCGGKLTPSGGHKADGGTVKDVPTTTTTGAKP